MRKRFGTTPVLRDVDFRVPAGLVVALLGPSGCGKTTLLRIIAGLERADHGTVKVGDRVVAGNGLWVPPERRRVGMVFQDGALFPHLTVARNVAYGLPRNQRHGARVDEALEMVGLGGMGDRMPGTLSGGQQQRVALARSLAPAPSVLLLDEPFSSLDTVLRVQVRGEVHRLLVELGITAVFVTHDQEEAFVLGDEVAVMHDGRIVQQARPEELYAQPVDPWVAVFVGDANLLEGHARSGTAETALGPVPLAAPASGVGQVLVRPEELHLGAGHDAVVDLLEYHGHDTVYVVRLDAGGSVRARSGSGPRHYRGDHVTVRYAGPPAVFYPAAPSSADEADAVGDDRPRPVDRADVAALSNGSPGLL